MITNPKDLMNLKHSDVQFQAKRYIKSLPECAKLGEKVEQMHPDLAVAMATVLLGVGVGMPSKPVKWGSTYIGTCLITGIKYTRVINNLTDVAFMRSYTRADDRFSKVNRDELTRWVVMEKAPAVVTIVDANWTPVFTFERVQS